MKISCQQTGYSASATFHTKVRTSTPRPGHGAKFWVRNLASIARIGSWKRDMSTSVQLITLLLCSIVTRGERVRFL